MQILNWLNQNASAVNVLVLVAYAIFTLGIWRETQRSAQRTEDLVRHSRKTFLLQALVALQEEIRSAKELATRPGQQFGRAWTGVGLLERALGAAFPEEWPELKGVLHEAAESWKRESGQSTS